MFVLCVINLELKVCFWPTFKCFLNCWFKGNYFSTTTHAVTTFDSTRSLNGHLIIQLYLRWPNFTLGNGLLSNDKHDLETSGLYRLKCSTFPARTVFRTRGKIRKFKFHLKNFEHIKNVLDFLPRLWTRSDWIVPKAQFGTSIMCANRWFIIEIQKRESFMQTNPLLFHLELNVDKRLIYCHQDLD